ncbi:MAG TPA: pitrilysin family protein [Bryobacteraceae bacterium]|nr:pitrilysin family protein [Bryobacteraceae bacterium]
MKPWILALLAAAAGAQTVDLTKPPETPPLADYKLPPVTLTRAANGLRIFVVEDKRFPIVTVRWGFQAGSKFDPGDLSGLAETTAALLKEGTTTRTSREIAEELATIGGAISASTTPDHVILAASALAEHLPKLMEILGDVVLNPSFPEEELELYKQNRVQELLAARSQADTLADERFNQVIYGKHPYARILPAGDSVARITRKDVMAFYSKFFALNNSVLIAVGSIPGKIPLPPAYSDWKRKAAPSPPAVAIPAPERRLVLVDRPGSVQADVRVGQVAVKRSSPEYFPLLVANSMLGGGMNSRMFREIREKKGYAYDAHSEFVPRLEAGSLAAVTQVRNEVAQPALADLLAIMKDLGNTPAPAAELATAKNLLSGTFVLSIETQQGLADRLASVKLYGLPDDYLDKYVTRIRSVEPAQVRSVASKYIDAGDSALVVVGDASKIAKDLEKLGKFTVEKPQ